MKKSIKIGEFSNSNRSKKFNYPKLNPSSKRSIGKMKGGFDQALLHLGIVYADNPKEVLAD